MESDNTTVCNGTDVDRISQLPDPVLHQILSPLMTKYAIRTMIMSKRWRDLWASMPFYYFDDGYSELLWTDEENPNFAHFVNSVLLCRDSSDIHSFCLWWQCGVGRHGQHHLDTWMKHVVARNVKILEISIGLVDADDQYIESLVLPRCIFACKSLEKLRLEFHGTYVDLHLPTSFAFGRLRKLVLENININNGLRQLISACPILEHLVIERCKLTDPDINSDTLKRLEIISCSFEGTRIGVSAPSLASLCLEFNELYYRSDRMFQVLFGDLSSLVEATIQLDDWLHEDPFEIDSLSEKARATQKVRKHFAT